MRLFKLFSLLSLFFGAHASSLKSREPAPHPLDVRDLLDVCASIDTRLSVPDLGSPLLLIYVGIVGRSTSHRIVSGLFLIECLTDACLCLSTLPHFLGTDPVGSLAVLVSGEQGATNTLTHLVCEQTCMVPWHLLGSTSDKQRCRQFKMHLPAEQHSRLY
jgi:hypothetical protein